MIDGTPIARRQFVSHALGVLTVAGVCGCAGIDGPIPVFNITPVDIGTAGDYASDGAYDSFAKTHGFFILRSRGMLVAASVICTHRHCVVEKQKAELACPCHGSRFDNSGAAIEGPASRPLPRFAISRDLRGRLIVDPSHTFNETQWNDPASFVKTGA